MFSGAQESRFPHSVVEENKVRPTLAFSSNNGKSLRRQGLVDLELLENFLPDTTLDDESKVV